MLKSYEVQTYLGVVWAFACKTICPLAARYKVGLPITTIVRAVVWENASTHKAAKELFDRPLTTEFWGIVDK